MSLSRLAEKSETNTSAIEIKPEAPADETISKLKIDAATSTDDEIVDDVENDEDLNTEMTAEADEGYFPEIGLTDMEFMVSNQNNYTELFNYFTQTKNMLQLMKPCMSPLGTPQEKKSDESIESAELLSGMQLVLNQTYDAIKADHDSMRQFVNDTLTDEALHYEYVQTCLSASRISYRMMTMFNRLFLLLASHKDKIIMETALALELPEITDDIANVIIRNHLGAVYEECLKLSEKVKTDLVKVKQKVEILFQNQNENLQEIDANEEADHASVASDENGDDEDLYNENLSHTDQSDAYSEIPSISDEMKSDCDGVVTCTAEFDGLGQVSVDVSPSKREISAISFLLDEIKHDNLHVSQQFAEEVKPTEESIYRLATCPHAFFHRSGTSLHRFNILDMDGFSDGADIFQKDEEVEAVKNLKSFSDSPRSEKSDTTEDEQDHYEMPRLKTH